MHGRIKTYIFIITVYILILVNTGVVSAHSTVSAQGEVNNSPLIQFTEPNQNLTIVSGEVVKIAWQDDDPDDNAFIDLAYYVNEDPQAEGGFVWFAVDIAEDADGFGDEVYWDTTGLAPGTYYIWAVISDGVNEPFYTFLEPTVIIQQNTEQQADQGADTDVTLDERILSTPVPGTASVELVTQTQYFQQERVTTSSGTVLEKEIIHGPAEAPTGIQRAVTKLPDMVENSQNSIALIVPAFNWSFGCSATSAAMIAGYFDRNGFPNMYTGHTNGGVMPLDNSVWPDWTDSSGATRHQCPLSATHLGLDGRTTRGHVDDYWVSYGTEGSHDPWYGNWSEHTYGDAVGDYMKTNQWEHGYENPDGATTFWFSSSGSPLYCTDIDAYRYQEPYIINDGMVGIRNFYRSRGYTVTDCYSQRTDNIYSSGFTFADYMAEIDAGYPVMIHVQGHTMVGVGYDGATNTVILHDTWDYSDHTMTWGGSYAGMEMRGVSIVHPSLESPDPAQFDFDGSGTADLSIYRPSSYLWAIKNQLYKTLGASSDIPVPADYDGDGRTDIAVFRPATGTWIVNGQFTINYGKSGDIPVPADYNGDGKADVAIYRPSNSLWAIRNQFYKIYGKPGDIPVPADYDGDGDDDIAIYRPSLGLWAVREQFYQGFGVNGDVPVPADYDGDGDDDIAIYRPSNSLWAVRNQFYQIYGVAGDTPVPADYNGDGRTDLAIFRSSSALWAVKDQFYQSFGLNGDIPLPETNLKFYR